MIDVDSRGSSYRDRSVLVIEDNPRNMLLISTILRSKGYAVLQAEDGEAGLARLGAEHVSLMVLDIQLPGISGLDVARLVRKDPAHRFLPILAVIAFAMSADRELALEAGCSDYMTKPIDIKAFVATVEELLGAQVRPS